jgi:short-subunit dehydrogenase
MPHLILCAPSNGNGSSAEESAEATAEESIERKIALVAGATRGAGRGIAIALGEAGATVYCTGRSSRKRIRGRTQRRPPPPHPADLKRSKKPLNWSRPLAGAALPLELITPSLRM